jgi:hypothetical protein
MKILVISLLLITTCCLYSSKARAAVVTLGPRKDAATYQNNVNKRNRAAVRKSVVFNDHWCQYAR